MRFSVSMDAEPMVSISARLLWFKPFALPFGKPIYITSGIFCEIHNRSLGVNGSENSSHLLLLNTRFCILIVKGT